MVKLLFNYGGFLEYKSVDKNGFVIYIDGKARFGTSWLSYVFNISIIDWNIG